ncbi:MAG: GHKL domain-containing protein [Oscillospiraceae bacterium]|nr:GHKL domain-containing protein [Oscillospiraceae bacterium]
MFNIIFTDYQNIFFNTARIFSSVFEIVLAYIMVNAFFSFRLNNKRLDFLPFVAFAGIMILLLERGAVANVFLKYLIEVSALIIILFSLYSGSIKSKLIGSMIYIVLISVSEIASSLIFSLLSRSFELAGGENFLLLAESGLTNVIMIVISVLIAVLSKHFRNTDTSLLLWLVLLSVPAITLITFSVFQFYVENYPENRRILTYIYLSCLGLLFTNILVFILFGRLQKQMDLKREKDMLSSQLSLQSASISRMETLYNRTRAFRHDIKNHILIMNMLAENENYTELKSYLQDMSGVIDESDYVRISGISVVDAILNEKMYEAQGLGITTSYDVINLDKNNVSPLDLCIILSNALDNAIEANSKVENSENRYIKLKVHGNETFSVISVSNPLGVSPKKNSSGLFLTSKSDTDAHGYGLKSIENTAHKYKGEMLAKAEDGVFTLVVRLNSR